MEKTKDELLKENKNLNNTIVQLNSQLIGKSDYYQGVITRLKSQIGNMSEEIADIGYKYDTIVDELKKNNTNF